MSKPNRRGRKKAPKTPSTSPTLRRLKESRKRAVDNPATTNGYGDSDDPTPASSKVRRKGGILSNTDDVQETASDLKLVESAVRERWDVRGKGMLQRRLLEVVAKKTVPVLTKHGIFDSESDADSNAIMASRVLVQMNGQDQDDDQFELKTNKPSTPGTTVNVNINDPESGRSRLLQLAESLGARELLIDGAVVPTSQSDSKPPEVGGVQPPAGEQVREESAMAKARAILGA